MTFASSTHPVLQLPYNARYKKPTRAVTLSFNAVQSIEALKEQPFHLSRLSFMLVSIMRLYVIKLKYLFTDTADLVSSFTRSKDRVRRILAITNAPLLLDINGVEFMEEDSVMDIRDSMIIDYAPDFSLNEIEVHRDEDTLLSEKAISMLGGCLKRKRMVDDIIEHEIGALKLKNKPTGCGIKSDASNVGFYIPSDIESFFKKIKREEIEVGRNETSFDLYEPHISDAFLGTSIEESEEILNEEVVFEKDFVFDDFVKGKDKKAKGVLFLALLNYCSDGRMDCHQEGPFERIKCQMVF